MAHLNLRDNELGLRQMTLKEISERLFLPYYKVRKWVKQYKVGIKLPLRSGYRFNLSDYYQLKKVERGEHT